MAIGSEPQNDLFRSFWEAKRRSLAPNESCVVTFFPDRPSIDNDLNRREGHFEDLRSISPQHLDRFSRDDG